MSVFYGKTKAKLKLPLIFHFHLPGPVSSLNDSHEFDMCPSSSCLIFFQKCVCIHVYYFFLVFQMCLHNIKLFAFFPFNMVVLSYIDVESTKSWSSLRLTSIESVMPSSHLILYRPLLLLPAIPPSIRVLSNE